MNHGKIAAIEGLPPDIAVEVFNYQVADRDLTRLSEDQNGKTCEIGANRQTRGVAIGVSIP